MVGAILMTGVALALLIAGEGLALRNALQPRKDAAASFFPPR